MGDAAPNPVSTTRLYLGNLPPNASKADIEAHFSSQGGGSDIAEVKLMNGFGFIEYKDSDAAREVVPIYNGTEFMGNRLVVQFARGGRPRDAPFYPDRPAPRTRRTIYRMTLSGLPPETSWQDLKDFTRLDGLDVVYSEVSRDRDGKGFVEYETEPDLKNAVDKIDGREFRGSTVTCAAAIQSERPRDRFRSRSPPPRRGYGGQGGHHDDYYDRRGPPRGYSPRGHQGDRGGGNYRDRSPPPARRGYYDEAPRDRFAGRSPQRGRAPPPDDYPAPRRGYQDDYAPPARGGGGGAGYGRPAYDDPYANGGGPPVRGGYGGRDRSPPRRAPSPGAGRGGGGYDGGYDRRPAYWSVDPIPNPRPNTLDNGVKVLTLSDLASSQITTLQGRSNAPVSLPLRPFFTNLGGPRTAGP